MPLLETEGAFPYLYKFFAGIDFTLRGKCGKI